MNKTLSKIKKLEFKLGKTDNPKARSDIVVSINRLRKRLAKKSNT